MAVNNQPESVKDILFTPQQVAAYIRSGYTAVGVFAFSVLTTYSLGVVDDWTRAAAAGLLAALPIIGIRGVVEGSYDARREATGNIRASDVGAHDPPIG